MTFKVLISHKIAAPGAKYLRELGYDVVQALDWETAKREIVDADAVMAGSDPFTREVLESAKKLKVLARFGAGCDAVDVAAATKLGIRVTNTPRAMVTSMAEQTLALILACAKNVAWMDKQVRLGNYKAAASDETRFSVELEGKTLGVLGFGGLGRAAAEKASKGLGMQILAYSRSLTDDQVPAGMKRAASDVELFEQSDFVALFLPLNESTRGFANKALFSRMRQGSYLLNLARGGVVNEPDLVEALINGPLAGAGLDVMVDEPPKPDNPLLKLDNVVLLPHTGSFTRQARDNMGRDAARCINEVLSGKEPSWPVNYL